MGNKGHPARRIDPCMNPLVQWINEQGQYRTLACCCGHGKYEPTIIVVRRIDAEPKRIYEWFTMQLLPGRRHYKNGRVNRRFYVRDGQGIYHLNKKGSEE